MVRLIVDDAGSRRAFNVGEGRLSVGSGAEAKLKLTSPGVASLHVEIEVHDGKATLHPKPGVIAPHVLGRAATGPVVLQHGVPVKIGGATVSVEYEGMASRAEAPAHSNVSRVSRGGGKGARDEGDEKDTRGRARKQGVPTWVWIAVGVPIVGVAGWFVSSRLIGKGASSLEASAPAYYQKALDRYKNAQFEQASEQLALIPAGVVLDEALAAQIAKLRENIKTKLDEGAVAINNDLAGSAYLSSQLKNFVDQRMSGKISTSTARVFMKRARYFREKWPTHSELEWVTRQEARFKGAVDLTQPPTIDDIAFEVETLTWSHPRNYKEAFATARAFQAGASGDDVQKIAGLLQELEKKRADWFTDRLEQARWHYDRKEAGLSLGVLLSVVYGSGDEAMADEAAERFLKFGDIKVMQTWLRGYRTNYPELFEQVSKNRVIAAFMRENPL